MYLYKIQVQQDRIFVMNCFKNSERQNYISQVLIDDLIGGYARAQVIYVTAKLGPADLMGDAARTVEDVAVLVNVDPDALKVIASLAR